MSRILCVDDEPHLRRTLGANLRARGYEVDLAESGERAIEIATTHKPDAIILDLGLPGMSGIQVIRALRHWTSVPIIVLSAREMGRIFHAKGVERLVRNELWKDRSPERFYDAMEWLYGWNLQNCLAH